jgi:methyl-accepting chemotaxis protein
MSLNVALGIILVMALAGGLAAVFRSYRWEMPTRVALALSGTLIGGCLLGFLWGASPSPFVRGFCGVALALAGGFLAWFLASRVADALAARDVQVPAPADHPALAALERIQGLAGGMRETASAMSEAVPASGEEEASGILEATSVIEEMNDSIKGIAENTERLSVSAEESSSSVLEMGATVDEVSGNMEGLSRSVEESVSSIEQMTSAVREVARNVEGLAEVAEQTSSSMDEMATTIKQVEENALESRRLSEEMVGASQQGSERMSATIVGIEAIRGASEEAQRVITSLGRRAEEIGEIVDVIDEVAEETNLLALNAAIIAAQAGEHGRGFSVVADEIKDLAERVGSSTKEIGKLIRAVQDESGNAVGAVRRGSELVAEGERLSQDAGRALEEITTSARRSGEMIGEIAQATAEQSKGSESVVLAMERVREMVTQIRGAMEEQTRGSEQVMGASMSMRDVTQQVKGMIHEQARGSGRITTNIENIREMVQLIHNAVQSQRDGASHAVATLGKIRERAESGEGPAASVSAGLRDILARIDRVIHEIETARA